MLTPLTPILSFYFPKHHYSLTRTTLSNICFKSYRKTKLEAWNNELGCLHIWLMVDLSDWVDPAARGPPVSPTHPRRDLSYTWTMFLSVLGPSCFLPWEMFQIETVHFVNRIPPVKARIILLAAYPIVITVHPTGSTSREGEHSPAHPMGTSCDHTLWKGKSILEYAILNLF